MTGFNGNDTIYMTTAIGSSFHDSPILGNISSHGTANTSCCPVRPTYPHYVCNDVGLATGSNYTYKGKSQYSLSEFCCEGNRLSVLIPVAASGLSFVKCEAEPNVCGKVNASVWGEKIYSSFSGIPSCNGHTSLIMCRSYDSGLNISGENGKQIIINGDAVLLTLGGIALSAAAIVFPPAIAVGLVASGSAVSFVGSSSQMVSCINTDTSCGDISYPSVSTSKTMWNQMFIDNGTWRIDKSASKYYPEEGNYSNLFSAQELLHMYIPCAAFSSSGCLHLEAQNIVACSPCYASCNSIGLTGATANLSIPILPSYLIGGTVVDKSTGADLSNQKVLIKMIFAQSEASKCVGYVVYTNSSGDYRFYAKPGCQYQVSLCSDPGYSYCLSSSSTNNQGGDTGINFNVYPVTFAESGLPSGQSWSVDFNGETMSTTASSITFGVPDGIRCL